MESHHDFTSNVRSQSAKALPVHMVQNASRVIALHAVRLKREQGEFLELRSCLHLGKRTQALDPRDKVIAFLGPASDVRPQNLFVSYTISVEKLYTRAMREILTQSRDLDDFSVAGLDTSTSCVITPS